MDEVELMGRVVDGDGRAIRLLVDDHYDATFRLLRHLCGSREDAEDLTQDVFLTARTKGRSFTGQGSLRAWLSRIAVNAHRKLCRRENLRRLCHLKAEHPKVAGESVVDSEWLLAGLAELSPDHRLALLLFEVHGFSVSEVAMTTNAPEGTVKARLHYARKHLQQILACPESGEKQ